MSSTLMKSVSGIRGIVGEALTPQLIVSVASAFASYAKYGTVVIGRDSRPTGDSISRAVTSVLSLAGCDVIDIGIVPTPTVQIMVEELNADGGIVISASHNPIEWNAFKLINSRGTFLGPKEIEDFFALMEKEHTYPRWDKVGSISYNDEADDIHIKKVTDIIDVNAIKKNKFSVALDSVNGAGSVITRELLSRLGCEIIPIHCTMNGQFPRGAEPLPQNLGDLSKAVIDSKADIGFAQDPDADRLAIVDNTGRPIGEENTIALVVDHLLAKEKGRVVINLSTTRAVDVIAEKYGVDVCRTKVGEINVVEEMLEKGARIGGEGNGGVISPEVHYGRDSLAGIGYILEMMSEKGKTIAEINNDIPRFIMKKGKVAYDSSTFKDSIIDDIKEKYKNEKLSEIDGLRIEFIKNSEFAGGWVHLRKSNTEPIFRIMAEGTSEEQAQSIYNNFEKCFT